MEILNTSLRLLAASQVLLFLLLFAASANPLRVRLSGGMLVLGIIGYLINSLFYDNLGWPVSLPLWFCAEMIPASLAVFVWVLFEEDERLPQWMGLCFVLNALVALWWLSNFIGREDFTLSRQLSYLAKALWVFVAITILWLGRELDLVEGRKKLRLVFISVLAALVLSVLLTEVLLGPAVPSWLEVPGMLLIFLTALGVNIAFVKTNPQFRLVGSVPVALEEQQDPVIFELLRRMEDERLYADHDLRVSTLAALLRVPEYQLRKKINQNLGYRNFNQFINKYRIKEAGARLLVERSTPVLTIALDVGFRSISSFNTAFQAQYGQTPTQHRSKHQ